MWSGRPRQAGCPSPSTARPFLLPLVWPECAVLPGVCARVDCPTPAPQALDHPRGKGHPRIPAYTPGPSCTRSPCPPFFAGKQFKCTVCDYTAAQKPQLLRHMEQHASFKVRGLGAWGPSRFMLRAHRWAEWKGHSLGVFPSLPGPPSSYASSPG